MRYKIYKFLAVVFLTFLIWTWAFLSLEATETYRGTLEVSPTTSEELFVTLEDGSQRIGLELEFKGAPAKVAELSKRNRASGDDQERLDFYYNPEEYGQAAPGVHTLDVLELIRRDAKTRQYALDVESCKPETIDVHVEKLVSQPLPVQVLDENGTVVKHEEIKPSFVQVYTRKGYTGSANVILTAQQIETARESAILERPFVVLDGGEQRRYAARPVSIRLPSSEPLKDQPALQAPAIGFIMSAELMKQYDVELLNQKDYTTLFFKATDEAMQTYRQQQYHILIPVYSGDKDLETIPPRALIFNFPQELVRNRLIEPVKPPVSAQIKLIPKGQAPAVNP